MKYSTSFSPLKIIPWAVSLLRKILSKDKTSTWFDEKLSSSFIVTALNPKIFLIQSLGRKRNNGSCLELAILDPILEPFGLIVNG